MDFSSPMLTRRAFAGSAVLFGAALALAPSRAFAVSAAEKQAEADAVRAQLVSLQADLEQAEAHFHRAIEERDAARAAMDEQQVLIDASTRRISDLQQRLGDRAVSMYRTGPTGFLDFMLGAKSFDELAQNWDLLNRINDEDARLIEETKQEEARLEAAQEEFAHQERIAADKAAEAERISADANERVEKATVLLNTLDAEARELLEQEQAAAAAEEAARRQTIKEKTPAPVAGPIDRGGQTSDNSAAADWALTKIGCPYILGTAGPDTFDCSGLVVWAYAQIGIHLPHFTESLYAAAKRVVPISQARRGDVLYRYWHCGIALVPGGSKYVHAPTRNARVRDTDPLSWSGFTCALQF